MVRTLADLGERKIIRQILPKFSAGIGDDCSIVRLRNRELVLTTEPVPEPAAKLLGGDPDPYWMGWLLVVINASDLAAAGATPLAFTAAIAAPSNLPIPDFKRFLRGIADACKKEGLAYVGGNLRESERLSGVGNAIGYCLPGTAVKRSGAKSGDILVSVGDGGIFWRDAFALQESNRTVNKQGSPVFRPRSQIKAMKVLAQNKLISAAMDNSDGLLPTLVQLASANSLTIKLDLSRLSVRRGISTITVDPARLWLGWGDWNVIAAVSTQKLDRASELSAEVGTRVIRIGEFLSGRPQVLLTRGTQTRVAPRLESERFSRDSWFATGIQGYIDLLLSVKLPTDAASRLAIKDQFGRGSSF